MFREGERNSVPVGVCGASVPVVCALLDPVLPGVPDVECEVEVEVDVDAAGEELGVDGLFEQAASTTAAAPRTTTGPTKDRRGVRRIRGG